MKIVEDTLDLFYGDPNEYRIKQIGEWTKLNKDIFARYIVPLARLYRRSSLYDEHIIVPKVKIGYSWIKPKRINIKIFVDDIPMKSVWVYYTKDSDENTDEKLYFQFMEFLGFIGGKNE